MTKQQLKQLEKDLWLAADKLRANSDLKPSEYSIPVRSAVENVLNKHLPESYDRAVFTEKCNTVFDQMLNYASQGLKWAA